MDRIPQSLALESLNANIYELRQEADDTVIGTLVMSGLEIRNVNLASLSSLLQNFALFQGGNDGQRGWLEDTDLVMRCTGQEGSEARRVVLLSGDMEITAVEATSSSLCHDYTSLLAIF